MKFKIEGYIFKEDIGKKCNHTNFFPTEPFTHKPMVKATLTYEVPIYDIDKFMDGIATARTQDNEIKEIKVSVDFYEELKDHVRNKFPPQVNVHGTGTLNIYGILITKGDE